MNKKQILAARGKAAKELIENPLYQEALIKIKGDLFNEFNSADLTSDKKRMEAWRQSQILDKFESNFNRIIRTGKDAEFEISQEDKPLRNVI